MNDKRRTKLRPVKKYLQQSISIVDMVTDEEQDSIDNTPETIQSCDRCVRSEEIVDNLREAQECLERALELVLDALSK